MPVRLICGLLILLSQLAPAAAQLPSPALDFVYPAGGQSGSAVHVEIGGRDLDDTSRLIFSHPGIVGRATLRVPSEFESQPQPVPGQFEVEIPLNVPAGTYDVRAVGRFGVSTPLTFVVGLGPEVLETGEHHSPRTANELPLDVVVSGRADGGAIDYYRFSASAGQTLIVECLARQIDSKLAPVLTIWNDQQQQLARSARLLDPVIDFQVPATGTYLLGVNDHTFVGGNDYYYRLRIHSGPYLVSISPLAAAPGRTGTFTVIGRNLPGGERVADMTLDGSPLEQQSISWFVPESSSSTPLIVDPVAAPTDGFAFAWPTAQGSSNALVLAHAQHPVIVEAEANNRPEAAQKIAIPCEFSGGFYPRRDQDWVEFTATRGQAYQLRVISNRLGAPTDPEIIVQKVTCTDDGQAQASQVATEDDFRSERDRYRQAVRRGLELSHHDPNVRFTADQDGEYRVGLRDLNGSSLDDPRFAYRLVIEPQRPDFQLLAWTQRQAVDDDKKIDRQALVLPRAGTLPVMVDVMRQGDFDQPVRILVEQLPTGVTASECQVRQGQDEAVLMLTATPDAAGWCGPIRIVGEAEINGRLERRVAAEAVLTGATDNVEQRRPTARLARQTVLAVIDTQPAPAEVALADPAAAAWETCVGAKLNIPLQFAKHAELKGDLGLTAIGLPEKIKAGELRLAPDATSAQLELTLDAADIPPGEYSLFLRGIVKAGLVRNPDAIARARQRRAAMNDVIARLDQEIQGAANQLALARQDVARRTTLLGRFQSLPQTVQQTLQAAGAQVDQVQAQLVALSSAAALAAAPAGSATSSEPAASGDTQLPESIDKLAHEVAAAAAAAGVQLQNAQAVAAHLAELLATAENELQSAQTAVAAAEDAQQQATERRKRADDFVKQLDQQLAEAEKSFGPVELSSYVYSPAFTLKVNRSPLFSQLPAEPLALRPGEMREVPVTLERRFGFTDAVDVSLKAPDGVTQIVAEPRRIESDRTEATLHINAALDAPPGEHSFEVILKLKFNGVELQDSIPLKIMVVQP